MNIYVYFITGFYCTKLRRPSCCLLFQTKEEKEKKNNNVSIRYAYEIVYSHRSIFIDILHRLVIIKSQPNS